MLTSSAPSPCCPQAAASGLPRHRPTQAEDCPTSREGPLLSQDPIPTSQTESSEEDPPVAPDPMDPDPVLTEAGPDEDPEPHPNPPVSPLQGIMTYHDIPDHIS